jgi:hypothetical protein
MMRRLLATIGLLIALSMFVQPIALAQQQRQLRRIVPRDVETRVTWSSTWTVNADGTCTGAAIVPLTLMTSPKHGTVRFDVGDIRERNCPNSTRGAIVLYKPNPGFVGEDEFVYQRAGDFQTTASTVDVLINVQ